MTIEKMRERYETRPFQPFIIHLTNGRAFTINHPEFLVSESIGRTITILETGDAQHIIDLLLVVELEILPETQIQSHEE